MDEKMHNMLLALRAITRMHMMGLCHVSGVDGCLGALHAILRDACVAAGAFRYSDIPLGAPGCHWQAWDSFLTERIGPQVGISEITIGIDGGHSMRLDGLTADHVAAVGCALLGDAADERARWLQIWKEAKHER